MNIKKLNNPNSKFPLGTVVATPEALRQITRPEIMDALKRHHARDWGILCDADKKANEEGLKYGARLLSKYESQSGVTFWIITEADRSATSILLPEEY